jgi:hypothetical protein
MANNPTVGVFIPGSYLNQCQSLYKTGSGDSYGNLYPTGLTLGKQIEIGPAQATRLTRPDTANQLFEGAYQWIQVDSGATVAYTQPGRAAFIKLDPGGTAGIQPELGESNFVVTSQDQADIDALWAGVFIEAIAPGSFGFIFVGGGRVEVNYAASLTAGQAIGDVIGVKNGNNGLFDDLVAAATGTWTSLAMGLAVVKPVVNGTSAIYMPTIREHIPNF